MDTVGLNRGLLRVSGKLRREIEVAVGLVVDEDEDAKLFTAEKSHCAAVSRRCEGVLGNDDADEP